MILLYYSVFGFDVILIFILTYLLFYSVISQQSVMNNGGIFYAQDTKEQHGLAGFSFLTTKSFDTCISSHLIHRYKQFRYFVTIRQLHYLLKWLHTHMLKLAISLQSSMWTIVTFKTVEIPSYDSVTNACVNDVMFQINIQESVIST